MKNVFLTLGMLCFVFCIGINTTQAQNGNVENQLKAKAISWYHTQCNGNYTGPIDVRLQRLLIPCPQGSNGSAYTAVLVPKVNCNQVPCQLILLIQLANLRFDCFGNIVDENCLF